MKKEWGSTAVAEGFFEIGGVAGTYAYTLLSRVASLLAYCLCVHVCVRMFHVSCFVFYAHINVYELQELRKEKEIQSPSKEATSVQNSDARSIFFKRISAPWTRRR